MRHAHPRHLAGRQRPHPAAVHAAASALIGLGTLLAAGALAAQPVSPAVAAASAPAPDTAIQPWQTCAAEADNVRRLACFDRWAAAQPAAVQASPATAPAASVATGPAAASAVAPAATTTEPTGAVRGTPAASVPTAVTAVNEGCHDRRLPAITRYWELDHESDCGVFSIRGYRPISLSLIASDGVNLQPASSNPLNNATTAQPYRTTETRIQLSVRTKIAQGLLTGAGSARDSLWFGYTQQSYWQLFTGALSRPFRSTDHEPEFVYVYPAAAALPGNWQLRYAGLGLVHQSNGQSLPLSRSWNRVYLMAGADHAGGFSLHGRVWQRLPEDAATDDNPDISDYIGRGELTGQWTLSPVNTVSLTARHSLRAQNRGSARLEWLRTLAPGSTGGPWSGLRLHTQLFNGYGDSLLDYNRRRTVLSVGLSLVDW